MRRGLLTGTMVLAALACGCDAPSHAVSGRLATFDGAPLADVTVHADSGDARWELVTDSDGRFSVPTPEGATLRLWTVSDRLPSLMVEGHRAGASDVELRMPETFVVSGVLVDDAGEPLAGRFVALQAASGDVEAPLGGRAASSGGGAYTADDGSFRVEGLLPGAHALDIPGGIPEGAPHLFCATEVVQAGTAGLRLVATPEPRVSGVVRDADGAPVSARIHVGGREVSLSPTQPRIGFFVPGTTAGPDGRFELTGLPPRPVNVTAAADGYESVTIQVQPPVRDLEVCLRPTR